MDTIVDQQICLRWNNFQSNFTAQFGTLRDHEDFVDVTIACGGRRFEAHKVVLSACSPFFKELFKSNPCPHPIIFMRDVESKHIQALLEFMYAGEVQVAQAHLAGFLRTAESLQIRGLTDASNGQKIENKNHTTDEYETSQQFSSKKHEEIAPQQFTKDVSDNTNRKTSFEEVTQNLFNSSPAPPTSIPSNETQISFNHTETQNSIQETRKHSYTEIHPNSSPNAKRPCKDVKSGSLSPSQYVIHPTDLHSELDLATDMIEPKTEPEYGSDEDDRTGLDESMLGFEDATDIGNAFGGTSGDMEMISGTGNADLSQDSNQALSSVDSRKLHSLDPRPCHLCGRVYSNLSNLRQHMRLIHHPQTVVCPYCGKQFKTTLYLKRHLVIYHNVTSDHRILPPTSASQSSSSPSPTNQSSNNQTSSPSDLDIKPDLHELNNTAVVVLSPPSSVGLGGTVGGVSQCYQNDLIIKKFDTNEMQNSTDAFNFYGSGDNKMMFPCQKEHISFQQL